MRDLDDFRIEQVEAKKSFALGASASVIDWMVVPAMAGVRVALDNASVKLETMRSRALAEAVRDGRLDFAVVREDSITDASGKNTLPLVKLTFHLCIPKRLLKRGTTTAALSDPDLWKSLPFAACKDGGQLDVTIREAMRAANVVFRPTVEM